MRVHYVLNHGKTPETKLADVEIHFEEGLLSGLKLVGCSVWRSKKGEELTVLVPARPYSGTGGIRYFDLIRPSAEGTDPKDPAGRSALRAFKDHIREEYLRIAASASGAGKKAAKGS